MKTFSVLFICTANICRTPMAEAILKRLVSSEGLQDRIQVTSAGTWALSGIPPSENSQLTCQEHGLDTSGYLSKPVGPSLMNESDLVLCMTTEHKKDLQCIFPHRTGNIFTIKEFGNPEPPQLLSINDPHGRNLDYHRTTFNEINHELNRIWVALKEQVLV